MSFTPIPNIIATLFLISFPSYSTITYNRNTTNAKVLVELSILCIEKEMPDDLVKKVYSHDYLAELFSRLDGVSTLTEISDKYGYKIEPLLTVVKGLILQGHLELISGNDEDIVVKVRRRPSDERS